VDIFENGGFFLSFGVAWRQHVNGVFGNRKWRFSKTLFRVEVFENVVFVFTCGRAKTEVFKDDRWRYDWLIKVYGIVQLAAII
jgi:hypothetical protein